MPNQSVAMCSLASIMYFWSKVPTGTTTWTCNNSSSVAMPMSSVCSWEFVKCDDYDFVTHIDLPAVLCVSETGEVVYNINNVFYNSSSTHLNY
jgi:hypothetical protein